MSISLLNRPARLAVEGVFDEPPPVIASGPFGFSAQLKERLRHGGNGPNTRRLYYLTSNLDWKDTPFANWKLMIASASTPVATGSRR